MIEEMASRRRKRLANGAHDGGRLGFEEQLWSAADRLRGHVEPAEYKHVVLGLIFLRFAIESQQSKRARRTGGRAVKSIGTSGDLFSGNSSTSASSTNQWRKVVDQADVGGVHRVLRVAQKKAAQLNGDFAGLCSQDFTQIPGRRLLDLISVIDSLPLDNSAAKASDVLGRVYEYFLAQFASSEGRSGGEYYTPRSVVQLLVDIIQPFKGKVYDPCCGTAGMFVQSERFVVEHGGRKSDVRLYGQESSARTLRLARMNLALRGLAADLGEVHADTFTNDQHPNLKADYVLANPPFNAKEWSASDLVGDKRWVFGMPPANNANFAWVQHIYSHLSDDGLAGFVLSNGSLSSNQGGELEIRQRMIEADAIECIITLPSQLFYGTQIPACLWFVSRNKQRENGKHLKGRTLLIDARRMGHLVDRTHTELSTEDRKRISSIYHSWRKCPERYEDQPGFAHSATSTEIAEHRFALVPGRYVGFQASDQLKWKDALNDIELSVVSRRLEELELAAESSVAALRMLRRG